MKIRTLFFKIELLLMLPVALLVVCVVRLLRPIVIIRFGHVDTTRIGHFAANTEMYLCERDAGLADKNTLDIFYYCRHVCNKQLGRMFSRVLHIFRYTYVFSKVNRWLPGHAIHMVIKPSDRDIRNLLSRTKPHLFFTPKEDLYGTEARRKLGIPDNAPFVCFHVRDSAYLNRAHPDGSWDYLDYCNCDVQKYMLAAETLANKEYYVVRMGAVVSRPLGVYHPKIIDYAVNGRSDFLDIYLPAKCSFFLASSSGFASVPLIFRKPIAWSNFVPLVYAPSWCANIVFIPKKFWRKDKQRLMTFHEMLDSEAGKYSNCTSFKRLGVEAIENTPEEIAALAIECDERLKGVWQAKEEDEILQKRFWALFKPSELHGKLLARIGADFLRQNRELLERDI